MSGDGGAASAAAGDAQHPLLGTRLRAGPLDGALAPLHGSPSLSDNDTSVSNSSWSLTEVGGNVWLRGGRWYYEVKVTQAGSGLWLGWRTARHRVPEDGDDDARGPGADAHSWAYDGAHSKRHRGKTATYGSGSSSSSSSSSSCRQGDVIGCELNLDTQTISFYKNGRDLGVAFRHVAAAGFGDGAGLAPVAALQRRGALQFVFGGKMRSLPATHRPLSFDVEPAARDAMTAFYHHYYEASVKLRASAGSALDAIKDAGAMQLAEDLGVAEATDDPTLLVLAWKFAARRTWEFSRDEFLGALAVYQISSLAELKVAVARWRSDLDSDARVFARFYAFVFDYLREDKTVLLLEEADAVWSMLDMKARWRLFERWASFVGDQSAFGSNAISKDTWCQLLNFANTYPTRNALDDYDFDGSTWPNAMDNFAEYVLDGPQ